MFTLESPAEVSASGGILSAAAVAALGLFESLVGFAFDAWIRIVGDDVVEPLLDAGIGGERAEGIGGVFANNGVFILQAVDEGGQEAGIVDAIEGAVEFGAFNRVGAVLGERGHIGNDFWRDRICLAEGAERDEAFIQRSFGVGCLLAQLRHAFRGGPAIRECFLGFFADVVIGIVHGEMPEFLVDGWVAGEIAQDIHKFLADVAAGFGIEHGDEGLFHGGVGDAIELLEEGAAGVSVGRGLEHGHGVGDDFVRELAVVALEEAEGTESVSLGSGGIKETVLQVGKELLGGRDHTAFHEGLAGFGEVGDRALEIGEARGEASGAIDADGLSGTRRGAGGCFGFLSAAQFGAQGGEFGSELGHLVKLQYDEGRDRNCADDPSPSTSPHAY